jgi:hypothetical protein
VGVLTAYQRFRFLWGAVDWQGGSDSPYGSGDTGANLGTSAAPGGGVAARRAVLHFDRTTYASNEDDAEMHFDFLNYTGGDPDDSWTNTDFATVEGYLATWWASVKPYVSTKCVLREIRWYRAGPGITPPNPAERVTSIAVAGTSSSQPLPLQDACSITFRNSVRRSWGRSYLPCLTSNALASDGSYTSTFLDPVTTATGVLATSAAGGDFPLVVVSKHLSALLHVEAVETDNVPDIIRRRRLSVQTYRKIINT